MIGHDGAMAEVQRVGQNALEQVAVTVAASFADDPIWKWIFGTDDTLSMDDGLTLARMLVARSTPADALHAAGDFGAVALWTAPLDSTDEANETLRNEQSGPYAQVFAERIGERMAKVGILGQAMAEHRPSESHWYLGILGTHPDKQNQGLGSQVLKAMLAEADGLGLPTFLESSNPRNYDFYRRHGYIDAETLTADDSPPLLGFWRPAQPTNEPS
jgi:GNAT superfamily N-acetyltransferase